MNTETLHAYLDGELDAAERSRVERALETDASLRAELKALRAVHAALGALPEIEASTDFTDRVVEAARPRRRGLLVRIGIPLAAAALLLLGVFVGRATSPVLETQRLFSDVEHLQYVWEADEETFGSLALDDLEERILEELERT